VTPLARVLYSSVTEIFVGVLILLNFVTICVESDARAAGSETPSWIDISSHIIYSIFVVELVVRIIVERRRVVRNPWNWLDAGIVLFGAIDYILQWSGGNDLVDFSVMRVLRLSRLLRVLRVIWRFPLFRELRKFILMLGSCFMTLMWAFSLMCVVMTVWAVVAVELINPIVQELADAGSWQGCERCRKSFSSVFNSNVTLFQTIIAGDSWGVIAIPVMEAHAWTSFIFVGSLLTLIFGVMNLIVAVLVETFAEIRAKDMITRAHQMDCDEIYEKKVLGKIFDKIDDDQSGALSWEEVEEGAKKVVEFRHWLRVLDIDAHDLYQLFQMVDADNSGEIDPQEFIDAMYRMKNAESKTATRFVKHLVTEMNTKQGDLEEKVGDIETKVSSFASTMETGLGDMRERIVQMSEEALATKLLEQEQAIEKTIEVAMQKASQVALEAALQAASATAASYVAGSHF